MSRSARISIHIPSSLRACVGGARKLDSSAGNVRDVLLELEKRQPELHRCICDETGALRRHIGVFVNTSHVRDLNGLDTTLAPGDVVSIMTAVSGG